MPLNFLDNGKIISKKKLLEIKEVAVWGFAQRSSKDMVSLNFEYGYLGSLRGARPAL